MEPKILLHIKMSKFCNFSVRYRRSSSQKTGVFYHKLTIQNSDSHCSFCIRHVAIFHVCRGVKVTHMHGRDMLRPVQRASSLPQTSPGQFNSISHRGRSSFFAARREARKKKSIRNPSALL